jgi:hypothetical protein
MYKGRKKIREKEGEGRKGWVDGERLKDGRIMGGGRRKDD